MKPVIVSIPSKKIIGKRLTMSMANNRTVELWRSFMINRGDITNQLSGDLISLQNYDSSLDFENFNPMTEYEKWAAVEVSEDGDVPQGMESFQIPAGLYAVFLYRGDPREFQETFHYIFRIWLPQSGYLLDKRPHFELLGEKYKNNDPSSEEEIWIPIKTV